MIMVSSPTLSHDVDWRRKSRSTSKYNIQFVCMAIRIILSLFCMRQRRLLRPETPPRAHLRSPPTYSVVSRFSVDDSDEL